MVAITSRYLNEKKKKERQDHEELATVSLLHIQRQHLESNGCEILYFVLLSLITVNDVHSRESHLIQRFDGPIIGCLYDTRAHLIG